jgi:aminomethyltransferase
MIPGTKTGIGMGYVKTAFSKAGSEIGIQIRNNNLKAIVVK